VTGPVVGIVLAGGASRRFGSDKLAAELDGRPLLHHALAAVAEVAGSVVVVIGPGAPVPPLPPALAARIAIARDASLHGGPLAGLGAGLSARGVADAGVAIVVGGDMPALVPGVLRLLVGRLAADPALVAVTLAAPHVAPLPMAVRPGPARDAIDTTLASPAGARSLRTLLDLVPSIRIAEADWRPLDADGVTLRDVDEPDDLEGLRRG
jgi:molybdopterin-guanine dinucleotide biosynthesis protein A